MGLIREPKNVDFFVEPKELTQEERQLITQYIKADQLKNKKRTARKQNALQQNIDKLKKGKAAA